MGSKRKHHGKEKSGSSLAQFYSASKFTIGDIKRKKENILSYTSKINSTNSKKTRKVMEKYATNV